MPRTRQILPLAVVAGLLLSALFAAPSAASAPAPDRATQEFEIKFMERTIEHHLLGIEMAELCVEKATDPPPAGDATLVDTCQTIIADQSAEVEQLQTWLRDWYGIEFQPKLPGGTLNQLEMLAGEDFDVAVSEMFIEHHLRQIKLSTRCLLRAEHRELQQFCQHTIDVQSADIVTFETILRQHGEEFRGS